MIEAVLLFGLANIVFEMVLLSMMPVRLRLKTLGSEPAQLVLHLSFLVFNLAVHWGTIVGTMSSVLAFCGSIVAVKLATALYGKIVDGQWYTVGIIKYAPAELL
jgi:hypothetical protein